MDKLYRLKRSILERESEEPGLRLLGSRRDYNRRLRLLRGGAVGDSYYIKWHVPAAAGSHGGGDKIYLGIDGSNNMALVKREEACVFHVREEAGRTVVKCGKNGHTYSYSVTTAEEGQPTQLVTNDSKRALDIWNPYSPVLKEYNVMAETHNANQLFDLEKTAGVHLMWQDSTYLKYDPNTESWLSRTRDRGSASRFHIDESGQLVVPGHGAIAYIHSQGDRYIIYEKNETDGQKKALDVWGEALTHSPRFHKENGHTNQKFRVIPAAVEEQATPAQAAPEFIRLSGEPGAPPKTFRNIGRSGVTDHKGTGLSHTLGAGEGMYFCAQAKFAGMREEGPVMLVGRSTFDYLTNPQVTHEGAFGHDHARVRTEYGVLVAVWKFPRDLNRIEFYDSDAMRGEELPVGHYPLTMDRGAWGEYMSYAQFERTPVSEALGRVFTKVRQDYTHGESVSVLRNTDMHLTLPMISLDNKYFMQHMWESDYSTTSEYETDVEKVGPLITILKNNFGVYALPVYAQHHALVFYAKTVSVGETIPPLDVNNGIDAGRSLMKIQNGSMVTLRYEDKELSCTLVNRSEVHGMETKSQTFLFGKADGTHFHLCFHTWSNRLLDSADSLKSIFVGAGGLKIAYMSPNDLSCFLQSDTTSFSKHTSSEDTFSGFIKKHFKDGSASRFDTWKTQFIHKYPCQDVDVASGVGAGLPGDPSQKMSTPAPLKVTTYNALSSFNLCNTDYERELLQYGATETLIHNWNARWEIMKEQLEQLDSDILMLNEVCWKQAQVIAGDLGMRFVMVPRSTELEVAILWKEDRLRAVDHPRGLPGIRYAGQLFQYDNLRIYVHAAHLKAGENVKSEKTRLDQLERILSPIDVACDAQILAGDLNTTRQLTSIYPSHVLDALDDHGWINVSETKDTYNGWKQLKFDYIYVKADTVQSGPPHVNDLQLGYCGPNSEVREGSDHTPVTVTLDFSGSPKHTQPAPEVAGQPPAQAVHLSDVGAGLSTDPLQPMSDCFEPEPAAESHLKIMSINLGNNIFKNMLYGSERQKVEHCREEYLNDSSQCTQNVAKFMASQGPDILGLQECSRNVSTFVDWMGGGEMYTGHQEKVGSHLSACAVVYNHHTMGQHESIDLKHEMAGEWAAYKEIHGVRSAAAVCFPNHGMIFASVWMAHLSSHKKLRSALEQFAQTVYKSASAQHTISRMVVAMDSNDDSNALSGFSVLIEGTDMRLKHNGSPHSCCDDSNYAYPGDYIMDTESNTRTVLMDVGGGFDPNLMSDHKPVCLEVEQS